MRVVDVGLARPAAASHAGECIRVVAEIVPCEPDAPQPPPVEPKEPTPEPSGWDGVQPFPGDVRQLPEAVAEVQRAQLGVARAFVHGVRDRMPAALRQSAAEPPARPPKGDVHVAHETGKALSLTVFPSKVSSASLSFDVHFVDTWKCDVLLRCDGLGVGLLPLLALLREGDLLPEFWPRKKGLPHVEKLDDIHDFARNDWMYNLWLSPWGPLPGVDDIHNLVLFDALGASERGLMLWAESPKAGEKVYRGFGVPPVKSWRRKRAFIETVVALRPSDAPPLDIAPPSPRPARCCSAGCRFFAHRALSAGGGTHCCKACRKSSGGKHDASCQRVEYDEKTSLEWALPNHGSVDVELALVLHPPIPTWMIPMALVRWLLSVLTRLLVPLLMLLNEDWDESIYAKRVAADASGWYAAAAAQVSGARSDEDAPGADGKPRFALSPQSLSAWQQRMRNESARVGDEKKHISFRE